MTDPPQEYTHVGFLEAKVENEPAWDKIDAINEYYDKGDQYRGHVKIHSSDYFITDNSHLKTKIVKVKGEDVHLINTDDNRYQIPGK